MESILKLDKKNIKILESEEIISDDWIFSSEAFGEADEYMACIPYFHKIYVEIKTTRNKYKINTRYIKHPEENNLRKTILFTHGHSTNCQWVTWIKAAVYLFNCDFDVIMIDLPGFGKSLINDKLKVHFKNWLEDGPDMIKQFLRELKLEKISVCGFCGGGALIIRAICQYPQLFDKNHIFYNLVISSYPQNFEKIIKTYKFNIRVFWNPDVDHPIYCVSYKYLKQLTTKQNENIKLININQEDINSSGIWAKGYGRNNSDFIFIFIPSLQFLNFMNSYYNENVLEYQK